MLTTVIAATVLAFAPPVDFQLKYKKGDSFTYVHHIVTPVLGVDATGDVVLTVTDVKNGVTTVSSSQIDYKVAKGRFQPLPAGKFDLLSNGRIKNLESESPATMLFMFCALPADPVSPGDDYKITYEGQGVSVVFDCKFTKLVKNVATLEMSGGMMRNDGSEAQMKLTIMFDVERGIYTSIVIDNSGMSTLSLTLKESK